MTLLINEIHGLNDLRKSFILYVADSRVTREGKFNSNRKKVFTIPYLNAGVGYFGLAQLDSRVFFSEWLPGFIQRESAVSSVGDFAKDLCKEPNRKVSKALLIANPSGFHICGYNGEGYPEFWFVRNIRGMNGYAYEGFEKEYFISEDFLRRDARRMGFDGKVSSVSGAFRQYYVNGDVRPYHAIWTQLDLFLNEMLAQPDFKRPKGIVGLEQCARWKLRLVSSFYKHFAKKQIIGGPVDAFVLSPKVKS